MDDVHLLQRRMLDAIQQTIAGTDWAPPDAALVTECVVIMGWTDGDGYYGTSHLRCGSPWGTEGLIANALREIEAADEEDE